MKPVTQHTQSSTDDTADSFSFGKVTHCGVVLGLLLFLLCIQGVSAYGGKPHYDLTIDALRDEGGFTNEQASYVASMDNMVDMISTAKDGEDGAEYADQYIVPNPYPNSEDIEVLFSERAHFQKPQNYTEMNDEWVRLQEQTYRAVKHAELTNEKAGFLTALGMSLHTVQDFYAHTNWSDKTDNGDFYGGFGESGDVTWFDVPDNIKLAVAEKTGEYSAGVHADTNKDYVNRLHYETSYREAYYGSRQWIRMVKSWVDPAFLASATPPMPCADPNPMCGEDEAASGCPASCDLNDIFMRLFWYTGTWNGPDSKHIVDMGWPIGEVPLDLVNFVVWESGGGGAISRNIFTSDEYYRDFQWAEFYGSIYLYNQTMPPSTSDAHPAFAKIPEVRWMKIYTTHVQQTDCDPYDIEGLGSDEVDFFSRLNVNNHWYTEAVVPEHDDLYPNYWTSLIPVKMDQPQVYLHYEIWDDDNPDRTDDDICDIWQGEDQVAWGNWININSGGTWVETDGLIDCDWLTGSEGDGDEAFAKFIYFFIKRAPTTTSVTTAKTVTVFGESVPITAYVSIVPPDTDKGDLTGYVEFFDGTTRFDNIYPVTGSLNVAKLSTSALAVGPHTITAKYLGVTNFEPYSGFQSSTSNTAPIDVVKASTNISVNSSKTPTVYGEPVTFTAKVGAVAPGAGTPTGMVTFKDGATTLGTGTLSGGSTTFTPSRTALSAGIHSITAVYAGDTNFTANTSTGITQVVNKASTTTTMSSSRNPSVYSQLAPTFMAKVGAVAPGAGTPTGTVTFKDGTTTLGTGPLSGGSAPITPSTNALSVGTHSITAVYPGDANFIGSASSVFTQTVNPPPKITAYVPNNGKRGTTAFKFVISGSAFQNGATVSLTKTGVPTIEATGVTVSSQKNSITCTLKIPSSAPTGSRSVLVKNPDEGTSTVSGFTVK
jgi:hypothetical protein